ncbi:Ribosomal protein S18 acetylase RimI [Collimonas sp. OK607]|uniref:GNAT family N-acetyltransferase n=1 Tax=Collimonas sp. OK607 TaxID=1798194 RepID=UPI0008EAE1EB|nr:GNAT family N-acetyltransferase [Collimonas sp. OK607]SFA80127.1 Ribosomal protein S18 acetylase RimI [Collimonas sp. OK607]
MTSVQIRTATSADIEAIVLVHKDAFKGFFLTSLGDGFLRELYRGFLDGEQGLLVVASRGQEILGFAAGTTEPDTFFKRLRRKRGAIFFIRAIPAILRRPLPVLHKIYGALFYKGDQPQTLHQAALLSSIGVAPHFGGKSLGGQLLAGFEQEVLSKGLKFVYLTTDQENNDHVNSFYTKYGYKQESQFMQQGSRPMLRYIKPLGNI